MKRDSLVSCVVGFLLAFGVSPLSWAQQENGTASAASETDSSKSEASTESSAAEGSPAQMSEGTAGASASRAPSAAPAEGGGLISVDFKDADIRQVLRIISLKSGVDIVAGTDVEGLVTIKLTNVPWEQALDIILRTYGFTYERKGKIVRVMTVDALESEALSTEVFPLDYAKAKEVPDVVKEMLSERGKVKFDERTNTVIVTDIPTNLYQIKEVIERLDQRTPQALIETKVVETKLTKNENLGIDWSDTLTFTQTQNSFPSSLPFKALGTLGFLGEEFITTPRGRAEWSPGVLGANPLTTLGSVGIGTLSTSQFSWTLNLLQQRTDTHIVSNPSLAVLNNQEAKIHIGEEYPIPNYSIDPTTGRTTITGYTAKDLGTVLTVTPHVNPSNEIVVDLKPEVITAGDPVTFNTGTGGNAVSLPRFTVQNAKTQVRIRSGETIAIGGLVKQTESKIETKVPILGDIPLVGLFFKNVQRYSTSDPVRQDLLIFLTVKLMDEGPAAGQAVAAASANQTP